MSDESNHTGVALVGCGTVGGAVAALLTRDRDLIRGRSGRDVSLRHVVDIDHSNARRVGLDESLFRGELQPALDDPEVGVVIELVGGTTFARQVVESAIRAGRHVVTANKALLSAHGPDLFALARDNGVCIAFEASCVGGVPVIASLTGGLLANRIDALYGIVNGTCNSILTEMTQRGRTYGDALADAQAAGLAEADPTLDVGGHDSAHKLTILASLAFGGRVELDAIPVNGIDDLDLQDIAYGRQLGYVIKLLAIASRQEDGLICRVRPAFISQAHPLARVAGPFNAVSVYGHATGHTMYYGRGAGGLPTASAVVADVLAVAIGAAPRSFAALGLWPDRTEPANQLPPEANRSRYYLRLTAEDRPGVLARLAAVFGRHGIGIRSVLQQEPTGSEQGVVPVVMTTHEALEGGVRAAIAEIDDLDCVKARTVCIDIVDEHPEQL